MAGQYNTSSGDYVCLDEATLARLRRGVRTASQLAAEMTGGAPGQVRHPGGGQPSVPVGSEESTGALRHNILVGAIPQRLPELPIITGVLDASGGTVVRDEPVIERRPLARVNVCETLYPERAGSAPGVGETTESEGEEVPDFVQGRYLYLRDATSSSINLHLCFPVSGEPRPLPGPFAWGLSWVNGLDPGSAEALEQDRLVLEAALESALGREARAGPDFPHLERRLLDDALRAACLTTGNSEAAYDRPYDYRPPREPEASPVASLQMAESEEEPSCCFFRPWSRSPS